MAELSSSSSEPREKLIADFLREIRQFNGMAAFFFRAAATRLGITPNDLQVIDLLEIIGPSTAGQLAELTGLTTGAITGMIDRLEKSGLVRRESDPNDGRRVLVRLSPNETAMKEIGPVFDSLGGKWDEIATSYDDAQLAFITDFLKASNSSTGEEIARLRSASEGTPDEFAARLGSITAGRLIFSSGASSLRLRGNDGFDDLYQAHFDGTLPEVKVDEGTITLRTRRRLWLFNMGGQSADIALNTSIPWQIEIRGGAAGVDADLSDIRLAELTVSYGMSAVNLTLPVPSGTVPIRVSGGASAVNIYYPKGVAVRVRFIGWVSDLIFEGEILTGLRPDLRLQSPGYDTAAQRYDIEISGTASTVAITSNKETTLQALDGSV